MKEEGKREGGKEGQGGEKRGSGKGEGGKERFYAPEARAFKGISETLKQKAGFLGLGKRFGNLLIFFSITFRHLASVLCCEVWSIVS